uniref:Uncharacterized protein n=1 Tax=Pithovirus LCDPAC02 TaxID=2506601 RepID=A0A481YNW1_9VIRU|nr:MAG: hypothetical protein LCDPAC02_01570 [Pithovirus LCDPAC02]
MEDVHNDIWIDCEKYITIQNYKFKIYSYGLFKYDNKSEIQIALWYISENCKLRHNYINIIYFNKEHNIETAIKLFNQTFERFNNTEESVDQFRSGFPKNINELVEFPECEDLLFEYMINTSVMHNIINSATCVIPFVIPNKYSKFISKIRNLVIKFKETEEYLHYIDNVKIDLINRIFNDLALYSKYSEKELLKELHKHINYGYKNGFFRYYIKSSNLNNKHLKEILDVNNCSKNYLPDNKYYTLDFDSCKHPSFKNFVFKKNNLEITLINYLAF